MIKAAFFDVDGTLLSERTNHDIPASARRALAALRAQGVKLVVCSGRPTAQLPEAVTEGFQGVEGGFDAFVTLSGSYCYDADGSYFEVPISPETVERYLSMVDDGLFDTLVLTPNLLVCNRRSERVRALERLVACPYPEADVHEVARGPVYQFCAFVPPEDEHIVADAASDCITARWSELFCDVIPAASGKDRGIEATLARLGLDAGEAVAFGDGGNDATMLAYCGIGVAMGNGTPEAKAAADYVTTAVDEDGILNACRRLGLIG